MTLTTGNGEKVTLPGIYRLQGDTLKICFHTVYDGQPPGDRPKAFATIADTPGVILTTLKRVPEGGKEKQPEQPSATIEGVVEGKKVQPDPRLVAPGAEAAVKLLAASNVCTFYGSPQNRPFDKGDWQREVVAGVQKMRSYLRVQFGKQRQIEGMLYGPGEKVKYRVSEVVFFFFEPGQDGPVENRPICLWARDGDRYYFANQIAGHEELLQWLRRVQAR
jgi:hypothetical protein